MNSPLSGFTPLNILYERKFKFRSEKVATKELYFRKFKSTKLKILLKKKNNTHSAGIVDFGCAECGMCDFIVMDKTLKVTELNSMSLNRRTNTQ